MCEFQHLYICSPLHKLGYWGTSHFTAHPEIHIHAMIRPFLKVSTPECLFHPCSHECTVRRTDRQSRSRRIRNIQPCTPYRAQSSKYSYADTVPHMQAQSDSDTIKDTQSSILSLTKSHIHSYTLSLTRTHSRTVKHAQSDTHIYAHTRTHSQTHEVRHAQSGMHVRRTQSYTLRHTQSSTSARTHTHTHQGSRHTHSRSLAHT